MALFACPYLGGHVELTAEREQHIADAHPDLLPRHRDCLAAVLSDPDQVRRSGRAINVRRFSKWYNDLKGGKHVVAVVVSDQRPVDRHWIVTAYLTRRLSEGVVEWQRD